MVFCARMHALYTNRAEHFPVSHSLQITNKRKWEKKESAHIERSHMSFCIVCIYVRLNECVHEKCTPNWRANKSHLCAIKRANFDPLKEEPEHDRTTTHQYNMLTAAKNAVQCTHKTLC